MVRHARIVRITSNSKVKKRWDRDGEIFGRVKWSVGVSALDDGTESCNEALGTSALAVCTVQIAHYDDGTEEAL